MIKTGRYRHHKGKEYEVLGVVLHTETREPMVLYKALYPVIDLDAGYGKEPLFVRPLSMWNEPVEGVERFKYLGSIPE
ncbi:MAG TPA: DUF1653 domain-containing protein [Candidatus Gracilibacteria bacterium]